MNACVKHNWHLIGTPDLKYTQSESVFTKHKKWMLISEINNIYTQTKWKLLLKLNEWKNECEQKQWTFSTYFTASKISCGQEMMAKLEAITSKMPLKLHQASSSHSVITVCMSANPKRVSMFMRRNPEESAAKQKAWLWGWPDVSPTPSQTLILSQLLLLLRHNSQVTVCFSSANTSFTT